MATLPSTLGNVSFINSMLTSFGKLNSALPNSIQNGNSPLGTLPTTILPAELSGSQSVRSLDTRQASNGSLYETAPNTGVTRSYNLEITHGYLSPDGTNRSMILINGQFPGPTLEANWGDTFQVTVKNSLTEGTSLHWHGILQGQTPWADGVPSVSTCPIAPGQSFTYTFQADQYGTSWYHSHYSAQYSGGALGPMIIYGPTDNYPSGLTASNTVDLGPILVSDWYHKDYHDLVATDVGTTNPGAPLVSDNTLIQGKMNTDCGSNTNCVGNAGVAKFNFQKGKTHRLRFINTGAFGHLQISLDNHQMVVIANDYVPLQPYTVDMITLGVGQRTDVLVTANQFPGAYWLRVKQPILCAPSSQPFALAAVYYPGVDTTSTPLSLPWPDFLAPTLAHCANDPLTSTVPYRSVALEQPDQNITIQITAGTNSTGNYKYYMNNSSFMADYNQPLLNLVNNGQTEFPTEWNVYNFSSANNVQIVFQNNVPFSHPMHVHGQNMWIVNEGTGTWDGSVVRASNPQRRDTQVLQGNGYLVVQLKSDNPGVWPFHCHIAWHLSQGFYINIVQRPDLIKEPQLQGYIDETCNAWSTFSSQNVVDEIDAGV